MSTRAIGSVLGISDGTVRNDQHSGARSYAPEPPLTSEPADVPLDVEVIDDGPGLDDQLADLNR